LGGGATSAGALPGLAEGFSFGGAFSLDGAAGTSFAVVGGWAEAMASCLAENCLYDMGYLSNLNDEDLPLLTYRNKKAFLQWVLQFLF
jgi:hypothetical protein